MLDILESALYALIFVVPALAILGLGYYVLDVITPGHKLGDKLVGNYHMGVGDRPSYSAGLVTAAWMIMQGGIIFTSIWTNGRGTDLWSALGWMVTFSIVGLVLQSLAFFALDLVTPGRLGDEVCVPGPVVPLAMVAAANIVAIGLVVIASIA